MQAIAPRASGDLPDVSSPESLSYLIGINKTSASQNPRAQTI
jgi:hypothetical protein